MQFEAETEFSIKVEGTSTLPYASRVQKLQFDQAGFVLKLVRPLPHELLSGAVFRMIFAVEEQRFEGLISLIGRDAYLQYGFHLPSGLIQAESLPRSPTEREARNSSSPRACASNQAESSFFSARS